MDIWNINFWVAINATSSIMKGLSMIVHDPESLFSNAPIR